jgi:hypothetical protein
MEGRMICSGFAADEKSWMLEVYFSFMGMQLPDTYMVLYVYRSLADDYHEVR